MSTARDQGKSTVSHKPAIMVVDLVDMYFISILGQPSLAAAVGFAGLATK